MDTRKYDAVIVGAGPAGHSCAVRIAELGGKVAIIERDFIGGICTNWGCTPSKAMIESAKVAKEVESSSRYGVEVKHYQINFPKVAQRRNQVVLNTRAFITDLLEYHNVDIYHGEALVEAPDTVRVRYGKLDNDTFQMEYTGEEDILKTDNIVLSTGSKPLIPGFIDESDPTVVSSHRLISIDTLPQSLTIVGGGVIGMEFATIFSNLGSQVTVVELLPRVLAQMDPDISAEITSLMEEKGVRVLTNHKVTELKDGVLKAINQDTQETVEVKSQMNLIAIGRTAVLQEELYDRLGLAYTRKGIEVDDMLQTSVPGVWAIGDATGKSILAHCGIQQGVICAENIMRKTGTPRLMDYSIIPAVVYSLPEIFTIGFVPEDLSDVDVVKVPFKINLRANIEDHTEGFLKLWIRDRKVVAAQAIGFMVSEIQQELANMIALGTDIDDVTRIVHAHPTYNEIIRSALEYAEGKAVDFHL
ncbi:MAG: FAD-dependent oxidoreductase [Anaerolineaceae bacterium]|nr:FAD-dependent oxidoreductase [Anaerolineaceae bacterium]